MTVVVAVVVVVVVVGGGGGGGRGGRGGALAMAVAPPMQLCAAFVVHAWLWHPYKPKSVLRICVFPKRSK